MKKYNKLRSFEKNLKGNLGFYIHNLNIEEIFREINTNIIKIFYTKVA